MYEPLPATSMLIELAAPHKAEPSANKAMDDSSAMRRPNT